MRVPLGQEDRAGRMQGQGPQQGRVPRGRERRQLIDRGACSGGVTTGEHDLDVGGQQLGPRHRVLGLVQDAAHGDDGLVDAALSDP